MLPPAAALSLGLLLLLPTPSQDPKPSKAEKAPPDALATARALATERFAGWTYGPGLDEQKHCIDCTCFVFAVVADLARQCGKPADEDLRRAVLIANIRKGEDLTKLIDDDDPRIRGVLTALVGAGLGERVEPKDARPGDFVQYWYRPTKGATTWAGHASMIARIEDGKAVLLGSHKSTLRERADGDAKIPVAKGGIGDGPRFDLTDPRRKVYVVRWTTPMVGRSGHRG